MEVIINSSLCQNVSNGDWDNITCLQEDLSACRDPTLCTLQSGDNLALAFGLTIGAGLATTIGALLPFIPFVKRANTYILVVGLALAAGVMLYVSFTEILTKSRDNFCCVTRVHFDVATTACFFGGVLLTVLLDLLVAGLQKLDCGCCCGRLSRTRKRNESSNVSGEQISRRRNRFGPLFRYRSSIRATNMLQMEANDDNNIHKQTSNGISVSSGNGTGPPRFSPPPLENEDIVFASSGNTGSIGTPSVVSHGQNMCTSNGHPPQVFEQLSQVASESDSQQLGVVLDGVSVSINSNTLSDATNQYYTVSVSELFSNTSLLRMNAIIPETASMSLAEAEGREEERDEKSGSHVGVAIDEEGEGKEVTRNGEESEDLSSDGALGPAEFKSVTEGLDKDTKQLHRMGVLTALAIGLHNLPEGMATFIAALSSPSLGIALAVAIALHNVPEGLCVAMPVYYATGSRWKAFLWAFLSGVSEPVGALLGWLVLKDQFGPLLFGIAFGIIAGMMVFISLKELLPTAYRFDKTKGRLVTAFLALGMLIMAISLVLFLY